VKKEIFNKGK